MKKKHYNYCHEAEQFEFDFTAKKSDIKESEIPADQIQSNLTENTVRSSRKPKTCIERKAEKEYYQKRFWENRVVNRSLYEYVLKKIEIPEEKGYRKFFWYLVLNLHRQHVHDILVGAPLIAAFLNLSTKSKAAKAYRFLEGFNREVMVPMGSVLKTRKHNYIKGKSRAAKKYHFGKHQQEIDNLLLEPITDVVFIKNGATPTKSELKRVENESLSTPEFVNKLYPLPEEAIFIKNYLNTQHPNFFTRLIKSKIDTAREMVKFLDLTEHAKKMQISILDSVEKHPMPHYQQSFHGKSVRLYCGSSIAGLTREMRRFFLADCPEGDLKCAQLAIGSVLFDYPKIYEFLSEPQNEGDIWRQIIPSWVEPENFDFVKDHVKEGTYSTQYTMARGAVYHILVDRLKPRFGMYSEMLASQIMESWVFQEMFDCVDKFVARLNNGLEVYDAFGRIYRVSETLNAGALMACVAQSYETKILYPAFKYVDCKSKITKRDEVRIVLFQFDGFNISVRDSRRVEFYKKEISKEVERGIDDCKANLAKKIPIRFEWKESKEKETKNKIKETIIPLLVPCPLCKSA